MSLSSKHQYLAKIHGRYQRAGRPHKARILKEFCLNWPLYQHLTGR